MSNTVQVEPWLLYTISSPLVAGRMTRARASGYTPPRASRRRCCCCCCIDRHAVGHGHRSRGVDPNPEEI